MKVKFDSTSWPRKMARERPGQRAFSLVEIMTVMVVIAILVAMLIPVAQGLKARAGKARCINNLKSLSVAANAYVQNQGSWPQINPALLSSDYPSYVAAWIAVLSPYNIGQINWICPTVQSEIGNPDLSDPKNARLDYTPMPFDAAETTPFKWAKHPWFVERNSIHGNGNLIIFTDGTIRETFDFRPR